MSADKVKRIGFIGAGQMATALAKGLISAEFTSPKHVVASDVIEAVCERFAAETDAQIVDSNADVLKQSEIIVLAIKPQNMADVLNEIQDLVDLEHLIVSIAAGVPLKVLTAALGEDCRVVRVMPNTPCLVGESASGFSSGGGSTSEDSQLVEQMLSTVGLAFSVEEKLLDVVTGLSGSGPAYVYQIIEALSDGGVRMGLPRDIATKLSAQTVLGAAKMVLETGKHPAALKDAVTSPGGTTIAGLHALEEGGLRSCLMNAVEVATLRSRELGQS